MAAPLLLFLLLTLARPTEPIPGPMQDSIFQGSVVSLSDSSAPIAALAIVLSIRRDRLLQVSNRSPFSARACPLLATFELPENWHFTLGEQKYKLSSYRWSLPQLDTFPHRPCCPSVPPPRTCAQKRNTSLQENAINLIQNQNRCKIRQ